MADSWRDLFGGTHFWSHQQQAMADDYFSQFILPIEEELGLRCNNCGDYFAGIIGSVKLSGVDGEGYCFECGHPIRWIHDIPGFGRLEGVPLLYKSREGGFKQQMAKGVIGKYDDFKQCVIREDLK